MTIEEQIKNERKVQEIAIKRRDAEMHMLGALDKTHSVSHVLALTQLINECQTRLDHLIVSRADSSND